MGGNGTQKEVGEKKGETLHQQACVSFKPPRLSLSGKRGKEPPARAGSWPAGGWLSHSLLGNLL